jgi:hypothetical protein
VTEREDINRPEGLLDRLAPATYGDQGQGEWPEELRAEEGEMADRLVRLAELMAAGKRPDDPAVLSEVDWYYRLAARYGGTGIATFKSLGDALVADERLRTTLDDVRYGLAAYHRQAINAYSEGLSEGGA